MPTTTPQKAPASAKILDPDASPTKYRPATAQRKTGNAARFARAHGTPTWRLHPVQRRVLCGPSDCFCQNENVLRSHHGHAYIAWISLDRPLLQRLER